MLLATVFLATGNIFAKIIIRENVPPLTMLGLRFVLVLALLWPWYSFAPGWRRFIKPPSPRWVAAALCTGVANAISMGLYFSALTELNPGLAVMIFSLSPVLVAVMMLLLGERLHRITIGRFALAAGGLYFLTLAGGGGVTASAGSVALIVGSAFFYAVHFALYQRFLGGVPVRTTVLWVITSMAVVFVLALPFVSSPAIVTSVTPAAWVFILFMAVLTTFVARLLMFASMDRIGGTRVALLGIAEPVLVLISSMLIFGERLASTQWIGVACVVVSLLLGSIDRPTRTSRPRTITMAAVSDAP